MLFEEKAEEGGSPSREHNSHGNKRRSGVVFYAVMLKNKEHFRYGYKQKCDKYANRRIAPFGTEIIFFVNIDFCGKFNIKNEYFSDIHKAEKQHKRGKQTAARGKAAGQRQNSGVGGAEGAEGEVKLFEVAFHGGNVVFHGVVKARNTGKIAAAYA